ncbi:hypothetical protein [Burkholderia territorii]|uniref:hypothetical protein n=1 Tax=Burkholderia territorii TaxID=1503055 RepID=UPI0012D8B661|nr:hypothetical protein [Burkholderia territorii]
MKDRAVEHRSEGRGINDADIGAGIHRMTPFLGRIRIVDLSRVPSGCHEASVMPARRHAHCDDAPGQPHGHRWFVMPQPLEARLLSFVFRMRFTRNPIRDVHISGPYCSARADEMKSHQRPGARAGCPTTQQ